MNIDKYVQPNKNIVIELDDEVEYLIDDNAIQSIRSKEASIKLIRLIDRKVFEVKLEKIIDAFTSNKVVDYLNI